MKDAIVAPIGSDGTARRRSRLGSTASPRQWMIACLCGALLGGAGGCAGRDAGPPGDRSPAVGERADPPAPAPERMQPGAVAADFMLTERDGLPFDSATLRGKVWLASVFFANCPGPCFRENQALADILRDIPDADFMVVSVTCDPDNDTPDVLQRYADRFQADPARWKFLTGDMATIKKIANETFLLPAEVGVHSERGVVFDRQGRLRGSYHLLQPDRVKLLEQLIRDVLAERDEPARGGGQSPAVVPPPAAGAALP